MVQHCLRKCAQKRSGQSARLQLRWEKAWGKSVKNHNGIKQNSGTGRVDHWCHCVRSRCADWRPNLLRGMSTAVCVGSRTVDSLLPSAFLQKLTTPRDGGRHTHIHTHTHTSTRAHTHTHSHSPSLTLNTHSPYTSLTLTLTFTLTPTHSLSHTLTTLTLTLTLSLTLTHTHPLSLSQSLTLSQSQSQSQSHSPPPPPSPRSPPSPPPSPLWTPMRLDL